MEEDKVENFARPPENIPTDITCDASEKTISNSDSEGELNLKSEVNQSLLHNDLHLFTDSNFITWENNLNVCWLDASMALLVHNQTMRSIIKLNPDCQVSQIIKSYDDAIATLNDFVSGKDAEERLSTARKKLLKVQESALTYLQPLIKCKKGEPDSAFCSLLNLIKEDKLIQGFFDVTYAWVRQCENCEMQRAVSNTKPIITITYVDKFVPENHCSPTVCHSCNKKDQKMKLVFHKLPACLFFHFENGAGDGTDPPLSFLIESREYQLTGVMVLEKSLESNVNHFVTYIRDPSVNKWLECNDLNMDVMSFSAKLPNFNLKDVYIYVYEAFDDLGTIGTQEDSMMNNSYLNIPCIDISDELDAVANMCQNKSSGKTDVLESEENIENIKSFLSNQFNKDSNTFFSEDKVCAQVHTDVLKIVSNECLDSKIKNTGLCGSSELILHEKNIKNEMSHPFNGKEIINRENGTEMKGITEPKLSGKYLLNQASEKIEFKKNSKMVTSVVTPVSKDANTQKWLDDLKSQFRKDKNKNPKNTHSLAISNVNLIADDQSSHMPENLGNTCTKALPVEAENKSSNKALNINSTIESMKESSSRANKNYIEDREQVLEKSNLNDALNSGAKLGFSHENMQILSQNKEEVNEKVIDRQNAKVDRINSKILYTQEKCITGSIVAENDLSFCEDEFKQPFCLYNENVQLMRDDNSHVNRSEDSDNLTSKLQIAVLQKEDSKKFNNTMSNKVLDFTKKTKMPHLESNKSSWVLENSSPIRETSVSLGENIADVGLQTEEIVNLNAESANKEIMKETSHRNKSIEKKELTNVQDSNIQKWIEREITLSIKDNAKKKQINELNDQCDKRGENMLHNTPFKPDKELSLSSHASNYSLLGERETGDEQLLLRMRKTSLKPLQKCKSVSSNDKLHGTGTSKSNVFPGTLKHIVIPASGKIQMASKVRKKILQVKFKSKSHTSIRNNKIKESLLKSGQFYKSPVQSLTEEAIISNDEDAPDMDLSNASCSGTTKSTSRCSKKSHVNSRLESHMCSLADNACIRKSGNDLCVNKKENECSSQFKKSINSPMQYSTCTSKSKKVPDMSATSSYNDAPLVNNTPKQSHKNINCFKNKSQNSRISQINIKENDSGAFSEEEIIKHPAKRKNISNDSDSSSSESKIKRSGSYSGSSPSFSPSPVHKSYSIHNKMSCACSTCSCKSVVSLDDAVDILGDNMYLGLLEIFGFI